ncbi:MAG TPA: urease accessory protein UreD [Myxococcaceae bacterium]|nr:urease accessory protein UreD [Myxococcaceae bacterium]
MVGASGATTRVIDVLQRAPLRILFPRTPPGEDLEAVLVNTAGGIAGGDRLECTVTALENASLAVTSQAPERIYRALKHAAHVTTKLEAHDGARLTWLPQETIIFNRARLRRRTEVEISSGAELLALEWFVLGRAAHGESVLEGRIADGWRVRKDGRLVWADNFRATEETFPHLHRRALLSRLTAVATLIHSAPDLDRRLEIVRELVASLGCSGAATSVGGLIIVRLAAALPSELRLGLRRFLQELGRELGSGPVRVPRMWPS